jgi:hypothetical protein
MSELRETGAVNGARSRTDRATAAFNASLPRVGRLERQIKRCFLAHDMQPVSTSALRSWCYPGQPRHRWQLFNVKRTLRRLNAVKVGRAGRAGIWQLPV